MAFGFIIRVDNVDLREDGFLTQIIHLCVLKLLKVPNTGQNVNPITEW